MPENIFLDRVGDDDFVKVLDFGIARDARLGRMTSAGLIVGTPAYIAPENITQVNEGDARGDIYGLGVLLYEMLCGEPPFEGGTLMETLAMHLYRVPTAIWSDDELDRADPRFHVQELALAMLAKAPSARPQTMSDVRRALQRIACSSARAEKHEPDHSSLRAVVDGAPCAPPAGLPPSDISFEARSRERVAQIPTLELAPARDKWLRDRTAQTPELDSTTQHEQLFTEDLRAVAQKQTLELGGMTPRRLRTVGVVLLILAMIVFVAATLLAGGGVGD